MALTNDQITAKNFKKFYDSILPYINNVPGCTPIGTVIAVMGNSAPANYLKCDGTVYNIADYTDLANYFEAQFEAKNYFGGDGTTTFAVPDLRGEFLRGTGENSHVNTRTNLNEGSGANVGVHQDATNHFEVKLTSDRKGFYAGSATSTASNVQALDTDTRGGNVGYRGAVTGSASTTATGNSLYTSRPTNTSVLYCIAYKDIYAETGDGYSAGDGIRIANDTISIDEMESADMSEIITPLPGVMSRKMRYSTDEQVVGVWVDGKPIYQKTVYCAVGSDARTNHDISNVGQIISVSALTIPASNVSRTIPFAYSADSTWNCGISILSDTIRIQAGTNYASAHQNAYVTIQYTKTTDTAIV